MRAPALIALASGLLLAAANTLASDGVLEVNQACVATGCFSGDAAGFPVTIDGSAGFSVRLTSDLVVPDANTTGVFVPANGATDSVTIDLGGFTIRGPTTCSSAPVVCGPAGTGVGVQAEDDSPEPAVTVRNGNVVGMGSVGIRLGAGGVVERGRAAHNGTSGIETDTWGLGSR